MSINSRFGSVFLRAIFLTAWFWSALAPAADKKKSGSDSDKPKAEPESPVVEQLRAAFDEGYVVGPNRLKEAKKLSTGALS